MRRHISDFKADSHCVIASHRHLAGPHMSPTGRLLPIIYWFGRGPTGREFDRRHRTALVDRRSSCCRATHLAPFATQSVDTTSAALLAAENPMRWDEHCRSNAASKLRSLTFKGTIRMSGTFFFVPRDTYAWRRARTMLSQDVSPSVYHSPVYCVETVKHVIKLFCRRRLATTF